MFGFVFENAHVFDGVHSALMGPCFVRVAGNEIKEVSPHDLVLGTLLGLTVEVRR